jgi:hypothetical protein
MTKIENSTILALPIRARIVLQSAIQAEPLDNLAKLEQLQSMSDTIGLRLVERADIRLEHGPNGGIVWDELRALGLDDLEVQVPTTWVPILSQVVTRNLPNWDSRELVWLRPVLQALGLASSKP